MYLDMRNKNFCYMLAAYPQSSRDRLLGHEMALSHEHLRAKKRQMETEAVSARIFSEGPGESNARGRGPAETSAVLGTMPELLGTSPCASSAPCASALHPDRPWHLCMGMCPPSIIPFFPDMSTKQREELFKLEDNVGH